MQEKLEDYYSIMFRKSFGSSRVDDFQAGIEGGGGTGQDLRPGTIWLLAQDGVGEYWHDEYRVIL
jgi:hypothetical protein